MKNTDDLNQIHTCSYQCERPACIRAQRDELVARFESQAQAVEVPDSVIVLLNHLETLMDEGKLEEDAIPTDMWNAVSTHNFALAQQPAPSAPVGVEDFDAAVAAELPRVSTLEYNSHEVCKHFASEVRKRLAQQPAVVDGVLRKVAAIAHSGGLIDMSPHDALTAIRRLSLPYWGKEEKPEQVHAALAQQPAAVDGAMVAAVAMDLRHSAQHDDLKDWTRNFMRSLAGRLADALAQPQGDKT